MTTLQERMDVGRPSLLSRLTSSGVRRTLRMTSGLILFAYIGAHMFNHALGLVSLQAAEAGMEIGVEVWYSRTGTIVLYGAAATHVLLALWAVYERRTFRLPPAELLRIALGFTLPIVLIGHAVSTRIGYELFGLSSDYMRVISNLFASNSEVWQLGVMAPGWLHGCLGLHLAFSRRPLYRRLRYVLFAAALLLPVLSALGFMVMGREITANPKAAAATAEYFSPANTAQRQSLSNWRDGILTAYFCIIGAAFGARELRNFLERRSQRLVSISFPGRTVRVPRNWTVLEASRSFHLPHASMCGGTGALLHLPGPGDGGRGELPAGRRRRAGHARPHRCARRCASRLSTAPAGRRFDRAAGAHRASGLPGGGSSQTQHRAATSS